MINRTIVLNGDYSFLNTVNWRRGVILAITGKTEVLKYTDKVLHTADGLEIKIPLVVKLIKVIRMIYRNRVPYSKKNVLTRDNNQCVYCGSTHDLSVDHIIPSSRGGKSSFENCVASCRPCNNKKNDRTPTEAKMYMRVRPYAPTISEFFRIRMKQLDIDKFLKDIGVY